ncbi:MAG: Calx-beta domain-containing protein [Methylobacter sp.]
MAITSAQQTQLLQLVQAMLGTAPNTTLLAQLSESLSAGQTLADLAQTLAGSTLFFGKNYAARLSPLQFASNFINDLVGNRASAADKAWAVTYITDAMATGASQADLIAELTQALSSIAPDHPNWGNAARHYNTGIASKIIDNIADNSVSTADKANAVSYLLWQMASGLSLGNIIDHLITLVDSIDHNDPTWGATAVLFDNRTEVLQYYLIDKADTALNLDTLQQALKTVTANADSIAIAKALINDITAPAPTSVPDDYAASISTTGKITVGGSTTGNIESVGDQDWFAVSMSAGTTYTIRQQGQGHEAGTLWNPSIAGIYSSTGALMPDSANDDSRIDGGTNGRDALVTFTPKTSGTYYIAAGASTSASGIGTYSLSVAVSARPSVLPIISLASDNLARFEGGNGDITPFIFTVTRTGDLNIASSVNWIVTGHGDNSADENDFVVNTPLSGTVNFAAGQATASITVNVQGDALDEPNEDFAVRLFNPSNAVVGFSSFDNKISQSKSGGFTGKDAAGKFIGDESIYTIPAGNGGGIFNLSYDMHSIADRADIYVNGVLAITTGTSVSESGILTIPSNIILKANDQVKVVITGTHADTAWDYTVNYMEGTPAPNDIAIGTILNDDAPLPTLLIAALSFPTAEGNSRPAPYIYTVTRSGDLNGASTVNWRVNGIGANPANKDDFVGRVLPSGIVTFAAGVSTQEIKVEVQGDTLFEPDEGFAVTLSNPSGATFEPADAIVESIIINDDSDSPLTIIFIDPNPDPSSISKKEGNSGETTTFTFNVVRSGDLSIVSEVDWKVTGSGANPARLTTEGIDPVNASDFNGLLSGKLIFAANEYSKEIEVNVRGDTTYEPNETFVVALSNPVRALLSTPIANTVTSFRESGGGNDGTITTKVITREYVLANGDGKFTLSYDMKVIPDQAVLFVNGVQTEFTGRTAPSAVMNGDRLTTSDLTLKVGDEISVVITGQATDPIWNYTLTSPDSDLRLDGATTTRATQIVNGATSPANQTKNPAGVATNTYTVTEAGSGVFTLDYNMGIIPDQAEIFINGVRNVFTSITNSFVPLPVTGGGTLSTENTPLRAGDIISVEVTSTDTDTIWDYTVNYPMGMAPLNTIINDDPINNIGRSNTVLNDDMWLA